MSVCFCSQQDLGFKRKLCTSVTGGGGQRRAETGGWRSEEDEALMW